MADAVKGKRGLALIIGVGAPQSSTDDFGPSMPPEARRRRAADVEASFLGRPQPFGSYDPEHEVNSRLRERAAGYMELAGAHKDGDCGLVQVRGGVSGERGCCNLFDPSAGAQAFECSTCEHFEGGGQAAAPAAAEAA